MSENFKELQGEKNLCAEHHKRVSKHVRKFPCQNATDTGAHHDLLFQAGELYRKGTHEGTGKAIKKQNLELLIHTHTT